MNKSLKRLITTAVCLACCAPAAFTQDDSRKVNRDPDAAKFVTSDIDNFWRAFDLAAREADRERKIAIYQTEYLDKGSPGLKDFVRVRIKDAKQLVETIERLPRFYASTRSSTLRAAEMGKQMRESFREFKRIYPAAVFPDVYFVVGVANTGGTATESGLLIGAELYGLTADTPRDEFPGWFKTILPGVKDEEQLRRLVAGALATALKPVEKLPFIVAHESCHFNQDFGEHRTLLGKSIQEGSCDFIAELIAGEPLNPGQKKYGDAHERELWREFAAGMEGTDLSRWMYNGFRSADRPGDLGYYVGYKITRSYYDNAKDKRQAVRDILNVRDFRAFLESSRYPQRFAR